MVDIIGGVDPGSMLVGLVALGYAILESRRNGSAIVKRLEASSGNQVSATKNNGQPFSSLTLKVKNLGIPLHEVTAHLVFDSKDHGSVDIELPIVGAKRAEFARGMVAEFRYESFEFGDWGPTMLATLTDPVSSRAKIVLKSQGLLAKEFYAYGQIERAKRKWNKLIWAINGSLMKRFPKRNPMRMLPALNSLSWQLENLARDSKSDMSRRDPA